MIEQTHCPLTVAVDGPVGAGKSTIADALAARLGILHLDTGAMYRALGLKALRAGVDPREEAAAAALCADTEIRVTLDDGQRTFLDGEDVSRAIRTLAAGEAASAISAHAAVRAHMVSLQRALAAERPMVLDGRDIGTRVLPDATVKFFLTATPEARARRRFLELSEKGDPQTYEEVLAALLVRDRRDCERPVDPLRQAEDAILIDTTEMPPERVVDTLLARVREACHEA